LTARSASASSPASAAMPSASPPAARICATVCWQASSFQSVQNTLAPWRANASALARPIPLPAPVTIATLPVSRGPVPGRWFSKKGARARSMAGSYTPSKAAAQGAYQRVAQRSAGRFAGWPPWSWG